MDIKIGFADSPRELLINAKEDQDALAATIAEALEKDTGVLELTDAQGKRYLVRNSRIAYVELGTQSARTVGFAGV